MHLFVPLRVELPKLVARLPFWPATQVTNERRTSHVSRTHLVRHHDQEPVLRYTIVCECGIVLENLRIDRIDRDVPFVSAERLPSCSARSNLACPSHRTFPWKISTCLSLGNASPCASCTFCLTWATCAFARSAPHLPSRAIDGT
eukprot:scaffold525_cov307-Pavlova_lutheri.AAC.12